MRFYAEINKTSSFLDSLQKCSCATPYDNVVLMGQKIKNDPIFEADNFLKFSTTLSLWRRVCFKKTTKSTPFFLLIIF